MFGQREGQCKIDGQVKCQVKYWTRVPGTLQGQMFGEMISQICFKLGKLCEST